MPEGRPSLHEGVSDPGPEKVGHAPERRKPEEAPGHPAVVRCHKGLWASWTSRLRIVGHVKPERLIGRTSSGFRGSYSR
jgi:hypothetical protein